MDKPETHAVLRQDTENGQTRDTGSIETRHIMDKPETRAVLRQDTEWRQRKQISQHRERVRRTTQTTPTSPPKKKPRSSLSADVCEG
jgi:hypothetical protein